MKIPKFTTPEIAIVMGLILVWYAAAWFLLYMFGHDYVSFGWGIWK